LVFEFRLERVLRYREEQEHQALVSLGKTQAQRELVARGLAVMNAELGEVRRIFDEMKGKEVDAQQLSLLGQRWRWLSLERERQRQLLQDWDQKVEDARELWLHARRAKEALFRLRQRALDEFLRKLERAEARELDEVGLRPFVLDETASLGTGLGHSSPREGG
jgi:flagellar export protein FliJ